MSTYGYSAHKRIALVGVSGLTKSGKAFVTTDPSVILENRVNGKLRTVTVLSDATPHGKTVVRLTGESARYV